MSEDLMYSTPEDQEFWLKCIAGLPGLEGYSGKGVDKFGELIPYGTGPHSLSFFREVFELVKPKNVFEIGFNMGYASAVFLELGYCHVYSCDISLKDETVNAAKILFERHGHRFWYDNRSEIDEDRLAGARYDLCFIDGGHLYQDVMTDINLCLSFDIQYFLFDDILPQFGEVQKAIDEWLSDIELVKQSGNLALYKNKNYGK